jgi:hypothetical protein
VVPAWGELPNVFKHWYDLNLNLTVRKLWGSVNMISVANKFFKLFLVSLFFLSSAAFGEHILEAKKDGVKVYKQASKKSDVVHTLKKGERVEAATRKGMYWKVNLSEDSNSFVSVFKVKKVKQTSAINDALQDAVLQGRKDGDDDNVRQRSAVMGVRGLDESGTVQEAGNVKPNMRLVYVMEDLYIPRTEVLTLEAEVMAESESAAVRKGL